MLPAAETPAIGEHEFASLEGRPDDQLALAEPGLELSVSDLLFATSTAIGELEAHGVQPGDRVIIALTNSAKFVIGYLAARAVGAIVVNLPWRARREIALLADALAATAVMVEDDLVGADPALRGLGTRRIPTPTIARQEPRGRARPPSRNVPRADSVAWLACTSGTTGIPKAAVHTERSWYYQTSCFAHVFSLTQRDPILVASPVGHAVGLLFGVRLGLMLGSPIVLVPRWSAATAAELTSRYGCAFVAAPAPFVMDVVAFAEQHGPEAFTSLRYFPSGGAPMPLPLLERAERALPETQVSAYFGTSEAGAVTICPPDTPRAKRLATDGRAVDGMEVTTEDGQLLVRGRQLALGYWEVESDRFRSDGWYATGDHASIDADGYIRMAGRSSDFILRGGENIAPQEIEDVLAGHPAVRDVAVVGFKDDRLGERVAAVVVARDSAPTLDDLRLHCDKQGLAPSRWPERIRVVPELPRSLIGKVRRDLLTESLGEDEGESRR